MPAIMTSPAETDCAKCLVRLESVSLKCSRCSILCHLRCSDLPEYMLLRFKTSQAAYICRACVLGEGNPESLKEEQDSIKQIMMNEKETIEAAAKDNNCSIDNLMNQVEVEEKICDASRTVVSVNNDISGANNSSRPEQEENVSGAQNLKKLCKYYVSRKCKHGVKGVGCSYDHPKKCLKFVSYGDKSSRGCKKGKKCSLYHPPLCYNAMNEGYCNRESCKYHHVKGTRFGWDEMQRDSYVNNIDARVNNRNNVEMPPRQFTSERQTQDSYAQRVIARNHGKVNGMASTQASIQTPGNDSNPQCFLEIMKQIQQMQLQIQTMLVHRQPLPVMKSCQHCQD